MFYDLYFILIIQLGTLDEDKLNNVIVICSSRYIGILIHQKKLLKFNHALLIIY